MADSVSEPINGTPDELLGRGIRSYVLGEFSEAVATLGRACELLVAEHGSDLHPSLGEVYLYYGKALIGLAREEAEALGDAVPKGAEDDDEDDSSDEEDQDQMQLDQIPETSKVEEEPENTKADKEPKSDDNSKIEQNVEIPDDKPGSSKGNNIKSDDQTDPQADESTVNDDLQVAWEILELAKKIYSENSETNSTSKKNLAECLIALGEISMENENLQQAVDDISEGLKLQKEVFGDKESRTVAETAYKLGMACSLNGQIDESISRFEESYKILKTRLGKLELQEGKMDEVKEIRALVPDLLEKIAETKAYKDEALKKIISAVTKPQQEVASSSSNSSKSTNDISHLVKRKRRSDGAEGESAEKPSKKPSLELEN